MKTKFNSDLILGCVTINMTPKFLYFLLSKYLVKVIVKYRKYYINLSVTVTGIYMAPNLYLVFYQPYLI